MFTSARFALIFAFSLSSLTASATPRFLGMFYDDGNKVMIDVDAPIGRVRVAPPGHLPNADTTLPTATRVRLHVGGGGFFSSTNDAIAHKFDLAIERIQKTRVLPLVKNIARAYGVDPAVVIGAILGELTFNNEFEVAAQERAANMTPNSTNFAHSIAFARLAKTEPALKACGSENPDYWSWVCMNAIWNLSVDRANGRANPRVSSQDLVPVDSDTEQLFGYLRPRTGRSYGLAQLSLMQALKVSSDVSAHSQYPKLSVDNMPVVLTAVRNQDETLHIIAAGAARSISAYKRFAGVDISRNLGLQITLFNLGYEFEKAIKLAAVNRSNKARGAAEELPRENYMGYWMNEFEPRIRALVK